MSAWLEALDLRDINLFCQDWGGLIGLRLVAAYPERFARVVATNTGLPAGAKRVEHVTIRGAGHFLQEDKGEVVAKAMIDFIRAYPVS